MMLDAVLSSYLGEQLIEQSCLSDKLRLIRLSVVGGEGQRGKEEA